MIGESVAHYRVLASLGRGGMGVVWLAEDVRLNRRVALKFIRDDIRSDDGSAEARLVREARAASALDHPNVATIYEVGEWRGRPFIAMAWYDGETLAERIARGPVPTDEAISILTQVADGLARAHAAGIVHRDLKPGNVIVTREGVAKILDFGLAAFSSPDAATEAKLTATHSTLGTVAYMAPEQAAGGTVDARADVWALGVIAFELFAGRRPFAGANTPAILHAILYDDAPDVRLIRPDLPPSIRDVVTRALRRQLAERLQSAAEFGSALRSSLAAPRATAGGARRSTRTRQVAAIALAVAAAIAAVTWMMGRQQRAAWARDVAVPAATKLFDDEKIVEAFDLAVQAEAAAANDPAVTQLLQSVARVLSIRSEPAGAMVSYRDYETPEAPWRPVGTTPLDGVRVPAGYLTWRLEKAGLVTAELPRWMGPPGPFPSTTALDVALQPAGTAPADMVHVGGVTGPARLYLPGLEHLSAPEALPAFWIDRHEVTNAAFKKFVDAGGYQRREYWDTFVEAGQTISWEAARARFVDSTGRYAPATWIQADHAPDQGQLPVTGVSWYEAAAYARFAGKSLPSIHHWATAAEPRAARWVVPFSNFGGAGPRPVADRPAVHQAGSVDMAGNVKEWVSTSTGDDGRRYILGGAWDEPSYAFNDPDARNPFDRARTFGFRCALFPTPPAGEVMAALPWATRDYHAERPAPDREYAIYKRLFAYDRQPIKATVTPVANEYPDFRREDVALPAAYGGGQFRIFLLLPRRGTPPFETVIFWPGSNAFIIRDFDAFPLFRFEFLLKSGRAVAFPEFQGTFGRQTDLRDSTANPTASYRDHVIAWVKDFSRTVDYLETRPDLSTAALAMLGVSWGGKMGAIVPAVEPRLKVQVLVAGGLALQRPMAEVDQIHFASRVTIPTLMLSGRHDFYFPVESSQKPMFEAFATPRDQKRYQTYEGGHGIPQVSLIREALDWLDRFQPISKR